MKKILSVGVLSFVLFIALFTTACPNRESIGKLEANPSKYVGKEIVIAGTVTNSYSIPLVGGVYKIDDGTGSIWVLARNSAPSKGAEVGLRGELQDGVKFGGKNYGLGVIEKERKYKGK